MRSKAEIVANSRSTRLDASSTRDQLIDVGVDLMRRNGYGATGLHEILSAAGAAKGSFYHYFGSKEEFAVAVLARYAQFATEHRRAIFENTRQTPLKRLKRHFEELIAMAGMSAPVQGCLLGSLSLEIAGTSAVLQKCIDTGFTEWQVSVSGLLREAMEKGELARSADADSLAGFVLNSWEGALLRSQASRSDVPLKEFLHYVFERLLTTKIAGA
jgi:TetR/AcrR family transcriptional regulator, transcriptional repressor for nem operon